jgi:D-glycero-alpha-D-manno-heptose-7-phosphate kinase
VIVASVPLRVSFLGGGTDYRTYVNQGNVGIVLGTTINLFVYVSIIKHSSLADFRYKVTYRKTDEANSFLDLKHPVVKPAFEIVGWEDEGVHISTMSDVPGGTGLGSSSAFTVGILHALSFMRGTPFDAERLAKKAIEIERDILLEDGGLQDQYHAAYGGLAEYKFDTNGVTRTPILDKQKIDYLSNALVLVPAGGVRQSSNLALSTSLAGLEKSGLISKVASIAKQGTKDFCDASNPEEAFDALAEAMNLSWSVKRHFAAEISNEFIEGAIAAGLANGASAGKLCGAGKSGFVLFLVKPESKASLLNHFSTIGGRSVEVFPNGSRISEIN